jgi:hypothetical protein
MSVLPAAITASGLKLHKYNDFNSCKNKVYVGFVVDKLALGEVCLSALQFAHQCHSTNAPHSSIVMVSTTDCSTKGLIFTTLLQPTTNRQQTKIILAVTTLLLHNYEFKKAHIINQHKKI